MVRLNSPNSSEEELPSTQQLYDFKNDNPRLYSKPQVYPLRPLKKSLNACPQCKLKFHNTTNMPYLLPACGHTFCKNCLSKMSYKSMIRCSLCSSMTYKELKKLPINFALVEALDSSCKKPQCKEHNSEIMAYCNTDETLLCGACTFAHRTHVVYLLTDAKIKDIASSKKNAIVRQEEELVDMRENWEKVRNELQLGLNELHLSVDKHRKALDATEERLCDKITQGCRQCVEEVGMLANNEEYLMIKDRIRKNLGKIGRRLERIREMKANYDLLPILEKLNKQADREEIEDGSPPSLVPVVKILEKLKGGVEYKSCIKKKFLKISENN